MKKLLQISLLGLMLLFSACAMNNADVSGHMEYQYKK